MSDIKAPAAEGPSAQTAANVPAKPKRVFSQKEKAMAWLSILLGYLFCRTFEASENHALALAFTVCLFVFSFVFVRKRKLKPLTLFYPVSALLISTSFFFSSSGVLFSLVFFYICVSFLLFCQKSSDTALEGRAGQLYFFETVKALFVSPLKSFDSAVGAIGSDKGGKKIGKTLAFVLAGLGVACIPTVIVLNLLSFDGNFTNILEKIRLNVIDTFLIHLRSLIIGVPTGMYIYGALYTSTHAEPDKFNAEKCVQTENAMKFAPPTVGAVAVAPLIFLYGVFIAAQFDYYKAVFTYTLPAAYTFSEFARDGFFRLCAVAAINALALIALRVFSQKAKNGKISAVVRIYTVVLSLITIVISGTAISQMIMYVSVYGLTRLRLYTLWFMALLILFFLVAAVKQFIEIFAATAVTVFVLCFALLAVPDTDAFIARHNYNCLLAGTSYKLDVDYLEELAPSSIPVLCEAAVNGRLPDDARTEALGAVTRYAAKAKRADNLPSALAEKAVKELDLALPAAGKGN